MGRQKERGAAAPNHGTTRNNTVRIQFVRRILAHLGGLISLWRNAGGSLELHLQDYHKITFCSDLAKPLHSY